MTDTIKLTSEKTEIKKVVDYVPGCYDADVTRRGRLVDLLLRQQGRIDRDGLSPRDHIFDQDNAVVSRAIGHLAEAYDHADQIMALLEVENDG